MKKEREGNEVHSIYTGEVCFGCNDVLNYYLFLLSLGQHSVRRIHNGSQYEKILTHNTSIRITYFSNTNF